MQKRTTIGAKSQIVIPKKIQEHLGIGQGDQVDWVLAPNGTAILRGFRSVPAKLITPELESKLTAREMLMDAGGSVRIRDAQELRRK